MHVGTSSAADSAADVHRIAQADDAYPPLLRAIHDPPPLLYVRGDPAVLHRPQLAVVGSRHASAAGLKLARTLCARLVESGLAITSGLALGVDGAAHRGALDVGGPTVAVMATGIDRLYPGRHRALGREVEQQGCLVTEFPPGTPPRKENFPRRNRIISGLSLGVLVVEAALPSGSLITARSGLEQGREVFALPWSVLHQGGRGCLQLLAQGAKMVLALEDILEELGPLYALQEGHSPLPALDPDLQEKLPEAEHRLLQSVGFEGVSADELADCTGWPVATVVGLLASLELSGHVVQGVSGYTRR